MLFNGNFALIRAKKASGLGGSMDGWMDRKLERWMDGCLIFTLPCVLQAFDTLGPLPKKSNSIPEMVNLRPDRTDLRPERADSKPEG